MKTTICNVCGKTFDMWDKQEDFGFEYFVGYGSKFDGEQISANFCCSCFDRILEEVNKKCIHKFLDESSVTSNAI